MLSKEKLKELEDTKELNGWDVLADGLKDVVKTGNLKYIRQFYSQDVKKAYQKDYDDRNITKEVDEWIGSAKGVFYATEVAKDLGLKDARYISKLLNVIEKTGTIEKSLNRAGKWRKVDNVRHMMDWKSADPSLIEVKLPLSIHKYVKIYKRTLIVFAGEVDSGKSCASLETVFLNLDLFPRIDLYLSEMHEVELKERIGLSKLGVDDKRWDKVRVERREANYEDVIDPDGLSIIDYMAAPQGENYAITDNMRKIYNRLENGVCLVCIQKKVSQEWGYGGEATKQVPTIYIALNEGVAKCVKGRPAIDPHVPLKYKIIEFAPDRGIRLQEKGFWHYEDEDPGGKTFLPEIKKRY